MFVRMFIPQPFRNALGRVALFAFSADKRRSLRTRRDRKHHLSLQARSRYPEMARCRPFADAALTREVNLQKYIHDQNVPPFLQTAKDKVVIYDTNSATDTPLPWHTLALPFSFPAFRM